MKRNVQYKTYITSSCKLTYNCNVRFFCPWLLQHKKCNQFCLICWVGGCCWEVWLFLWELATDNIATRTEKNQLMPHLAWALLDSYYSGGLVADGEPLARPLWCSRLRSVSPSELKQFRRRVRCLEWVLRRDRSYLHIFLLMAKAFTISLLILTYSVCWIQMNRSQHSREFFDEIGIIPIGWEASISLISTGQWDEILRRFLLLGMRTDRPLLTFSLTRLSPAMYRK